MNLSRYLKRFSYGVALLLMAAGPAPAAMHTVQISNFTFSPQKTSITPGDTVRWVMISGTHTTTSDPSSPKTWNSGVFPSGNHFDVVFTASDGPGPFPYHCSIHATMKDTIFIAAPAIMCGDANGDGAVNVGDAVSLIAYVFKGGAAPDPVCAGNANGDADTNVGDAVSLISYVFKGGAAPVTDCCP